MINRAIFQNEVREPSLHMLLCLSSSHPKHSQQNISMEMGFYQICSQTSLDFHMAMTPFSPLQYSTVLLWASDSPVFLCPASEEPPLQFFPSLQPSLSWEKQGRQYKAKIWLSPVNMEKWKLCQLWKVQGLPFGELICLRRYLRCPLIPSFNSQVSETFHSLHIYFILFPTKVIYPTWVF